MGAVLEANCLSATLSRSKLFISHAVEIMKKHKLTIINQQQHDQDHPKLKPTAKPRKKQGLIVHPCCSAYSGDLSDAACGGPSDGKGKCITCGLTEDEHDHIDNLEDLFIFHQTTGEDEGNDDEEDLWPLDEDDESDISDGDDE